MSAGFIGMLVWAARAFGGRGPIFAFLVVWIPLAWFPTVGLVWRISLPAGWYALRPRERAGKVYERVGVRVAKRALRRGPLSVFSRSMRLPANATRQDKAALMSQMENAETSHVLAFLVGCVAAMGTAIAGAWSTAGLVLLFNCLVNVYPVMLQRYNRGWLAARMPDPPPH